MITVSTTADSGAGSLRAAITAAIAAAEPETIVFAIGSGAQIIALTSPLPEITADVTIDGTTQPGYASVPLITLDGVAAGADVSGLTLRAGTVLRALSIVRFTRNGVEAEDAAGVELDRCHVALNGRNGVNTLRCEALHLADCTIGTDPTGMSAQGNGLDGCFIEQSPDCVIEDCVVSGNRQYGVLLMGQETINAVVRACRIGCDSDGLRAIPNTRTGVLLHNCAKCLVGGPDVADRNIISGNGRSGVNLDGSAPTLDTPEPHYGLKGYNNNNCVQGNFIGVDATGRRALANGLYGVLVFRSQHNVVGGTSAGVGNVIAGNGDHGVALLGWETHGDLDRVAHHNIVAGNRIGCDLTGQVSLPNKGSGVYANDVRQNRIGAGNVIRNNRGYGIESFGTGGATNRTSGNTISKNVRGGIRVAGR